MRSISEGKSTIFQPSSKTETQQPPREAMHSLQYDPSVFLDSLIIRGPYRFRQISAQSWYEGLTEEASKFW